MADNALAEAPGDLLQGQVDPAILAATMIHNALQRDPVAPAVQGIISTIGAFSHGGLHDVMQQYAVPQPSWSDQLSRLLNSPAANEAIGALTLKPVARVAKAAAGEPDFFHSYSMHNERGANVGPMLINAKDPKHLYVEWMGRGNDLESGANTLGPKEMLSLLRAVKERYPDALTISGYRAGGARFGGAAADEALKGQFGIGSNEEPLIHLQRDRKFVRDTSGKIRELKAMPEGFQP